MRYIKIRNEENGQEVAIDTYLARYKRLAYGFQNSLRFEKRFLKHIVLTQTVESYNPKMVNNFFNKMRRFYKDVIYIWTIEIQEERAEKYGDSVIHWHIIFGFKKGTPFGREDVLRIQQYWKYGNVDISPAGMCRMSYLMKYISKALGSYLESVYQIRRIGSSRIAGWLRQTWSALTNAITYFARCNVPIEGLGDFWWSRGNAWAKFDYGEKICVYRKAKTPWFKICSGNTIKDLEMGYSSPF
ncbi:MAG: hypothetical protein A2163_09665 [Actinobacteria bacterium RBG_13_35_12]|nr:MAG: hypothetical protein A2163_09665 [Actinobacteria bacterium RBG_13_35_12]